MLHFAVDPPPPTWWDKVVEFFDADRPPATIVVTIAVAIGAWVLGGLVIRAATRGIRKGTPPAGGRKRLPLRKRKSIGAAQALKNRLEAERRQQRAGTIGIALRSLLGAVIIVVAAGDILSQLGVKVGPLLAAAGILGVALGFGAQSLVKDVLSGMFILLEDQYGVGDSIDLGEATGAVEEVGLRVTRLRSLDGTVWFVPNGEIRRVGNKSRLWSRAMVQVRVDYEADLDAAVAALLDAATAAVSRDTIARRVLSAPTVPGVESIAADGAVLRVFVQVQPGQQWDVERAIRAEIPKVFRERGVRFGIAEGRVMIDGGAAAAAALTIDDLPKPRRAKRAPSTST